MVKIDKGIPIPLTMKTKYPFLQMEVGDSFLMLPEDQNNCRSIVCNFNRDLKPKKFLARKTPDGVRVWRTE